MSNKVSDFIFKEEESNYYIILNIQEINIFKDSCQKNIIQNINFMGKWLLVISQMTNEFRQEISLFLMKSRYKKKLIKISTFTHGKLIILF